MNDPMGNPTYEAPKKNNRTIIIAVVVVVLLCCCCIAAIGGWYLWNSGDTLMNSSGFINMFA